MDNFNQPEVSRKTKEEIQGIKDDFKDIAARMRALKDEGLDALYQESGEIMETISEMKDRMMGSSQTGLNTLYNCIEKNPVRSAVYSFGAGMILAMLLRK